MGSFVDDRPGQRTELTLKPWISGAIRARSAFYSCPIIRQRPDGVQNRGAQHPLKLLPALAATDAPGAMKKGSFARRPFNSRCPRSFVRNRPHGPARTGHSSAPVPVNRSGRRRRAGSSRRSDLSGQRRNGPGRTRPDRCCGCARRRRDKTGRTRQRHCGRTRRRRRRKRPRPGCPLHNRRTPEHIKPAIGPLRGRGLTVLSALLSLPHTLMLYSTASPGPPALPPQYGVRNAIYDRSGVGNIR